MFCTGLIFFLSKSSNTARVGRPVVPILEIGKLTREEATICPSIHALHHMRASEREQGETGGEDEVEDPHRLRKMRPPVYAHVVDALPQLEVRRLQSSRSCGSSNDAAGAAAGEPCTLE